MDIATIQKQWGIALTGGIACGKSTIAQLIRKQGFLVVDADQLTRELTAPGGAAIQDILETFGEAYLLADGSLNRSKMRELVFQDEASLRKLEGLLHPRLPAQTLDYLMRSGWASQTNYWFYEATLIFEKSLAKQFREIWCAYCSEAVQIERVMARDHISEAQARQIIQKQMPAIEKASQSDLVIHSDCSLEQVREQVEKSLQLLV